MPEGDEDSVRSTAITSADIAGAEDLVAEIGDHVLDHILKGGTLDGVPIVGWFAKIARTGIAMRDLFLVQKLVAFLGGVERTGRVHERFRLKLETDENFKAEVRRLLPVTLDRLDEAEKARLLGVIFTAFIFDEITRDEMRRLSSALERVYLPDLLALREALDSKPPPQPIDLPAITFRGLEAIGLVLAWHSIVRPIAEDEREGKSGSQPIFVTAEAVRLVAILFPPAARPSS